MRDALTARPSTRCYSRRLMARSMSTRKLFGLGINCVRGSVMAFDEAEPYHSPNPVFDVTGVSGNHLVTGTQPG